MYPKFAQTSNVKRFLDGVGQLERRGAGEACWMLGRGEPGLGKTKTLQWWATQKNAVYLRAKTNWSPSWMLGDLVEEFGQQPERRFPDRFAQLMGLLSKSKRAIVIDEARNMLHDMRLLETIRDLTDAVEPLFILGGEEFVAKRLEARFPQISSRISSDVTFERATLPDVRACCDELSEVAIADDLVPRIHGESRGYYREIKNAIAAAEAVGKRRGGKVKADDLKGVPLCHTRGEGSAR
jgi:DNA transposition AAA+ family ATPase